MSGSYCGAMELRQIVVKATAVAAADSSDAVVGTDAVVGRGKGPGTCL